MYTLARADSDKSDPGRAAGREYFPLKLIVTNPWHSYLRSFPSLFLFPSLLYHYSLFKFKLTNPGPGELETGAKVDSEYQPK